MEYIAVLAPSIVVGLLFWFVMKSIFNADKAERQAEARAQQELAAAGGTAAAPNADSSRADNSKPDGEEPSDTKQDPSDAK